MVIITTNGGSVRGDRTCPACRYCSSLQSYDRWQTSQILARGCETPTPPKLKATAAWSKPNNTQHKQISPAPSHTMSDHHLPSLRFERLLFSQLLYICTLNVYYRPTAATASKLNEVPAAVKVWTQHVTVWHNLSPETATLPEVKLQTGHRSLVSAYEQDTKPFGQCCQVVGRRNVHSSLLQHYISLNNSWTCTRDI